MANATVFITEPYRRECLTCGHVACRDSSPHRHATAHFHGTHHPNVTSLELGEDWVWCYVDDRVL